MQFVAYCRTLLRATADLLLITLSTASIALSPSLATAQRPLGPETHFFNAGGGNHITASVGGLCWFSGTVSVAASCSGAGITISGTASATAGGSLHASAYWNAASQTLSALGYSGSFAFTQANYNDSLTFSVAGTTPTPTTVTFRLSADGSTSGTNGTDPQGQYGLIYSGFPGASPGQTAAYLRGQNVSSFTDFTVPIIAGAPQYFSFYLLALAGAGDDTQLIPSSGSASSDFSHTMRVLGYSVKDATGDDITNSVSVTSALGVRYATITSTPEPDSFTLLGIGLLALLPMTVAKTNRRSHRR